MLRASDRIAFSFADGITGADAITDCVIHAHSDSNGVARTARRHADHADVQWGGASANHYRDRSGTATFTASGCSSIATLGTIANGAFTVTSVAAGTCTITVSDAFNHQATIAVGVTTLGVPIQ